MGSLRQADARAHGRRKLALKRALVGAAACATAMMLLPIRSQAQPITCWYNDAGQYTGADSGTGMPVGKLKKAGHGDYAWGYTINARDGNACPKRRPRR